MDAIFQDIRSGLRSLRKSPSFAVVTTLTLALAIGVTTAIFSMVSAVVFADLPMADTERTAVVRGVNPAEGVDQGSVSLPDFRDLRERATSFEALSALTPARWILTSGDEPERVTGFRVTPNLLDVWGRSAALGRSFTGEEARPGGPAVAMISHAFWQDRYGGSPEVLGRTLRLDGVEHTVVGVAPPAVEFADFAGARVWVPLREGDTFDERDARVLFVTGALREGVTQERATEEVAAIGEALAREHPATNAGWGLWSAPATESLLGEEGTAIFVMLILMVAFIMLIACANVANMLLARTTSRAREMSIRTALGAGRLRIVRQLLTEGFAAALLAAGLGLLVARGLLDVLVRLSRGTEQVLLMAEIDGRVLGFTLVVAFVAPLLFGLVPALGAASADSAGVLRESRDRGETRGSSRLRTFLVGAQVSLALALMVLSGLVVRSVMNLRTGDLGFDPGGLATVELVLPEDGYGEPEARVRFLDRVLAEVEGLSAVDGAASVSALPAVGFGLRRSLEVEGRPEPAGRGRPPVDLVVASAGYFDLVGLPVLEGRGFDGRDRADGPPVAVVSREVARRYWPERSAVGQRVRTGTGGEWVEVVGVVGDVRHGDPLAQRWAPNMYRPYAQLPASELYLVAGSDAGPGSLAGPLRDAVHALDPSLPVDAMSTLELAHAEHHASSFALSLLFAAFALFALAMAAVGIYGVMSYNVSRRTSEIGVRMALGARPGSVRWMVVAHGGRMVLAGMVVGLMAAFVLSRLMSNLVFGITTTDPLTFVGVPAVLALVALAANYLPALRATRTDPVEALRAE